MSLRIATSEWISGALVIGETGLGVLGANIPSSGTSGAAYTYNDLSLPADAAKEICGRILSLPGAGTLFTYEDTSFTFTGAPNGVYVATYQLYVDGVSTGSPATITFTVGNPSPTPGFLTITGYAPTVTQTTNSGGSPNISVGLGALTITGYAPTVVRTAATFGAGLNPILRAMRTNRKGRY